MKTWPADSIECIRILWASAVVPGGYWFEDKEPHEEPAPQPPATQDDIEALI